MPKKKSTLILPKLKPKMSLNLPVKSSDGKKTGLGNQGHRQNPCGSRLHLNMQEVYWENLSSLTQYTKNTSSPHDISNESRNENNSRHGVAVFVLERIHEGYIVPRAYRLDKEERPCGQKRVQTSLVEVWGLVALLKWFKSVLQE